MGSLDVNLFVRLSFDKDSDMTAVKSQVVSICNSHSVVYESLEITDGSNTDALLASKQVTIKNIQEVGSNPEEFEQELSKIDKFKEFDQRLTDQKEFGSSRESMSTNSNNSLSL
jgi:hypothetical protein